MLASRERRVVTGGILVVVVALVTSTVLLPFARSWHARELRLGAARAELATLASLVARAGSLDAAAQRADAELTRRGRRVFRARSIALAASALQSYLQDASDASRIVVTRLDVTSDAAPDAPSDVPAPSTTNASNANASIEGSSTDFSSSAVSATLSAQCDIYGLAELLALFSQGPRVVQVSRMTVLSNSSLRGAPDMLQVTLVLRAPVVIE
jgi:hypothetical protein